MNLPPPDDPCAPHYWMYETSGVLAPAVTAYINGDPMTGDQVGAMRAYLRHWIMSPVWDMNPHGTSSLAGLRDMLDSLTNRAQITAWLQKALEVGIDPL